MAFVPHFQAFSTGHASSMEGNIMEGNSVLHDREREILTSPTGQFCSFSCGSPCPAYRAASLSCDAFKAADFSGKGPEHNSSAEPHTGNFFLELLYND